MEACGCSNVLRRRSDGNRGACVGMKSATRRYQTFNLLSGGGAGTGGVCEDGGIGVGAVEAIATETHPRPLITIDPSILFLLIRQFN